MSATVENVRHFSICELRRCGALNPGAIRPFIWRSVPDGKITRQIIFKATPTEIHICFEQNGRWKNQSIPIQQTVCSYGGFRPWFQCGCGRRVGVLFDGGGGFFCRQCLRLRYRSQLVTANWRAIHRAQTIKMRLGGSTSVLEPFPKRPRYMRRKRYEILRKTALLLQAEGLGLLDHSLERRLRRARRRAPPAFA